MKDLGEMAEKAKPSEPVNSEKDERCCGIEQW